MGLLQEIIYVYEKTFSSEIDMDYKVIRVLFDGIKSLSTIELVFYFGIFIFWVIGIANLLLKICSKKIQLRSLNFKNWLIGTVLTGLLKLLVFEFVVYIVSHHDHWYKLSHLLIPEAVVADIFGGLTTESTNIYRLSFYIGILIVSPLFTLPLLAIRKKSNL